MRIRLNFINKNQRIFFLFHLITRKHTDLKIKIVNSLYLVEKAFTQRILHHIQLNKVFKQLLPHITDDVCFADLTSSVNQQNLLGIAFQLFFYQRFNLSE